MISSDQTVVSESLYKLIQNIRALRSLKGWTQDTMATLLKISEKTYAKFEQGNGDIQWSRLEEIASLLGVKVEDLVNFDRGMIFNFITHHSQQTATFNQSSLNSSSTTSQQLEHELEQARLVIEQKEKLLEQKEKEVGYLKEIIELMKKG
jgi:transcriptional regulator with XRE-family HTH domain